MYVKYCRAALIRCRNTTFDLIKSSKSLGHLHPVFCNCRTRTSDLMKSWNLLGNFRDVLVSCGNIACEFIQPLHWATYLSFSGSRGHVKHPSFNK
jgi:hypothetical protein